MTQDKWTHYLQNNLENYFLAKGFTEEELKTQLEGLSYIILANTTSELLSKKPPQQKFSSEEEIANYIKANFTSEELDVVLKQQADSIFKEYLDAIDTKPASVSSVT